MMINHWTEQGALFSDKAMWYGLATASPVGLLDKRREHVYGIMIVM